MIPNAEIKEILKRQLLKWFDDSTKKWNRNALFDAVWNGDSERITKEMNAPFRRTISYHDYREDFYHAFLQVSSPASDIWWIPTRNTEKAGAMWLFYDSMNARVAIF